MTGPTVESLLLADYAEVIDGKLYVMGGGFSVLGVDDFRERVRIAMGAVLRVPADIEAQTIPLLAEVLDTGGEARWRMQADLEAAPPGGVALVAGPVELQLAGPGDLVLTVAFGDVTRSVPFRVVAA